LEKQEPFYSALRPRGCYLNPSFALGTIIGLVDLLDCFPTQPLKRPIPVDEYTFGNFDAGRFAWLLTNPRFLPAQILARGSLGLWEYDV